MRSSLAILALSGIASAAPLQIAPPNGACSGKPIVAELLPANAFAGSAKILASPRGFDVFWTAQPALGSHEFMGMYAAYSRTGQRIGDAVKLIDQPIRNVASDGAGGFAIVYQASITDGWQAHVAGVRAGKVSWDVAIPSRERGHGSLSIGWDAHAGAWVVVGEELVQLPNQAAGYVYNRLFVARLDHAGAWLDKPRYVTDPLVNAQLSDWGNPLTGARGRVAFAWTTVDGSQTTLYVSELDKVTAKRVEVARSRGFFRVAIAATARGYAVAGGEDTADPLGSRAFVTTIEGTTAAPMRYLSPKDRRGSEPVIASDGKTVAVAWNEDITDKSGRRTAVRAVVVAADGTLRDAYDSKPPAGETDWVESMTWDGCRFALVHTYAINPSASELVRF